jgi:hypothetical protein
MSIHAGDEVVFRVRFSKGDTVIGVGESGTVKSVSYRDGGREAVTYFVVAKRMLWMCFPGEIVKKLEIS